MCTCENTLCSICNSFHVTLSFLILSPFPFFSSSFFSARIDKIIEFLETNSQVKISLTVAVVDREAEINKKVRKQKKQNLFLTFLFVFIDFNLNFVFTLFQFVYLFDSIFLTYVCFFLLLFSHLYCSANNLICKYLKIVLNSQNQKYCCEKSSYTTLI